MSSLVSKPQVTEDLFEAKKKPKAEFLIKL